MGARLTTMDSINHDLLSTVDNEVKAYVMGWVNSGLPADGCNIRIYNNTTNKEFAGFVSLLTDGKINLDHDGNYHEYFDVISDKLYEDATIKGSNIAGLGNLAWAYVRGFVDGSDTSIYQNEVEIRSDAMGVLENVGKFSKIPHQMEDGCLRFVGANCVDFLGKIYPLSAKFKSEKLYEAYINMISSHGQLPNCHVFMASKDAVFPTKAKPSDVGYDLTIISLYKKISDRVSIYDTGVKLSVENGVYVEVVPRSSLSKSGYILANSVGIIDPSYTGNILVALAKIDDSLPDLQLPFKCCQLIFRKQIHANLIQVQDDGTIQETSRGEGGFGSSG